MKQTFIKQGLSVPSGDPEAVWQQRACSSFVLPPAASGVCVRKLLFTSPDPQVPQGKSWAPSLCEYCLHHAVCPHSLLAFVLFCFWESDCSGRPQPCFHSPLITKTGSSPVFIYSASRQSKPVWASFFCWMHYWVLSVMQYLILFILFNIKHHSNVTVIAANYYYCELLLLYLHKYTNVMKCAFWCIN